MGLEIIKDTDYNVEVIHWVLNELRVNRRNNKIHVEFLGFAQSGDFQIDVTPLATWNGTYDLSNVPASITTPLVDLKDAIEAVLIASEPYWEGAILVND